MRMNTQTEYGAHTKSPRRFIANRRGCLLGGSFHDFLIHAVTVAGITQGQPRGGDRIQAELQRQLDAWLAENPDWNK